MTPKDQAGTHPSRVSRSSGLDLVGPVGIGFKASWDGHFHTISTARPGRKNPLSSTVTAAFSTRSYAILQRLPVIPPNHRDYFFFQIFQKES